MLYKSGTFLFIPLIICGVQTCGGYRWHSEMECRGNHWQHNVKFIGRVCRFFKEKRVGYKICSYIMIYGGIIEVFFW